MSQGALLDPASLINLINNLYHCLFIKGMILEEIRYGGDCKVIYTVLYTCPSFFFSSTKISLNKRVHMREHERT